ncbi:MAG: carboxypeptidase-like regulatory domain-containing protein [Gammaproteobacteria bacterium]|nr:carboxypeptidase-like regulatory domain-containing protein [Gammaproteobacteria bacterium]
MQLLRRLVFIVIVAQLFCGFCVTGQQTGDIEGVVTATGGAAIQDIRVTANSEAMPRIREAWTDSKGRFAISGLIPGTYQLVIESRGGVNHTTQASVVLNQLTVLRIEFPRDASSDLEELVVVGQRVSERGRGGIANGLDGLTVRGVPSGRDYRDLVKLAPGVQYSQDAVRGPSSGGSGQDNVYRFDGVDVTLPMFGTLAAEPSSHDIEQVTFERGAAGAVGFNRSGGFVMDSNARSGTDEFEANLEYVTVPTNVLSATKTDTRSNETDQRWATVSGGGPIVPGLLYFYGSFFSPYEERSNQATAYGNVKNFTNSRQEYFGKLTYTPSDGLLINASYRTSARREKGVSIGPLDADSVSVGGRAEQDVKSISGSWSVRPNTTIGIQYDAYFLRGSSVPDSLLDVVPSLDDVLDVSRLDQMGYLKVPAHMPGADEFNAAIASIIQRYGSVDSSGDRQGGGGVGAHPEINEQAFRRRGFELTFDHRIDWGKTRHVLHAGFRRTDAQETLLRTSNGWGTIEVPGGVDKAAEGTPVFYVASVQQMSIRKPDGSLVGPLDSYTRSISLELNDTLSLGILSFDLGVLISEDVLYGQGLRSAPGTFSGFVVAPGTKYRMYTIHWRDMIQPRVGAQIDLNGETTLFTNFARYNPEASSLARAASWDRNTRAQIRVLFDEDGNIIEHEPYPGSSGKIFQQDLTPRRIDEWVVGVRHGFARGLVLKAHLRQRNGSHYWEDTWNGSRGFDNAPSHITSKGPYVPDLATIRAEIGGSSYVIAELDDANTLYREAAIELEWRNERAYLDASYVRSRYTGNFDQDNTSSVNDANRFIGSSNVADGYGRQLWDNKDGVLRGDRPHILKAFGYLDLRWQGRVGAYVVYQSGQPWEAWDSLAYGLPSYFSSTIRFAEAAGSRRSANHWQLDLSYEQSFHLTPSLDASVRFDLFNVFDRQTGYNIDPYVRNTTFGQPRSYFEPRRLQLSVGIQI